MWSLRNILKWKRVNFDPPLNEGAQERRNRAEEDTNHDLQKPVQQFLCDVHEEANRPPCEKSTNEQLTYAEDRILDAIDKLSCENKRMVALQTVTAHAAARTANWIMVLTFVLVILTFFLASDLIWKYIFFDSSAVNKSTWEDKLKNTAKSNIKQPQLKQNRRAQK